MTQLASNLSGCCGLTDVADTGTPRTTGAPNHASPTRGPSRRYSDGMLPLVTGMPGGVEWIILLIIVVPIALIVAAAIKYLRKK